MVRKKRKKPKGDINIQICEERGKEAFLFEKINMIYNKQKNKIIDKDSRYYNTCTVK